MEHLGDITKIIGYLVPFVNVVIGGSPCQDLSVAGKRLGLAGQRSGLFMEQIRIIKEMRKADANRGRSGIEIRPRFMVWENVPGAFSSNGGADFGAVLEETIRVVCEESPSIPVPKNGWTTAGCLYGMGGAWSVAWRVFDAQFWGVPQRRRRIALVADFGGCTAPEILFERESLSGDSTPCGTPWERIASNAQSCIGITNRGFISGDVTETLRAESHGAIPMVVTRSRAYGICSYASNSMMSDNPHSGFYEADTSRTLDMNCGNPACNQGGIVIVSPAVYDARGNGNGTTVPTLTGDHENRVTDYTAVVCIGNGQVDSLGMHEKVGALNCMHDQQIIIVNCPERKTAGFKYGMGAKAHGVGFEEEISPTLSANQHDAAVVQQTTNKVYTLDRAAFNQGINAQYDFEISDNGINPTLVAKGPSAVSTNTVRRLTPLECERLQGFPDGWTDIGEWTDSKGKVHKECADTARYKALGNSIALPPWLYVLQKLSLSCGGDCTMASLFDGIGGFPLLWEYLNGRGTCLWASEIEEFPIAVTKYHFPEVN